MPLQADCSNQSPLANDSGYMWVAGHWHAKQIT